MTNSDWTTGSRAHSLVNETVQVAETIVLWKMSETAVACNICGSSYTLPGNKQTTKLKLYDNTIVYFRFTRFCSKHGARLATRD